MPIELKISQQSNQTQRVNPENDVFLSIAIGNAQIGGSYVEDSEGNLIVKGAITNFNLGRGSALVGQRIKIFTNVLDKNPNNNDVIVFHRFSNIKQSYKYEDTAPEKGVVSIQVEYLFTL